MAGEWNSGETLAWTEHDGPGSPPAGPVRWMQFAVAGTLTAVFIGVMFTDALCPQHQVWVDVLGVVALVGTVASVIGLIRGWASSWWLCLISAFCGVAIGWIDSLHDATRGTLIALAFSFVAAGCVALGFWAARLRAWETQARRAMTVDAGPVVIIDSESDSVAGRQAEPERPEETSEAISTTRRDVDELT